MLSISRVWIMLRLGSGEPVCQMCGWLMDPKQTWYVLECGDAFHWKCVKKNFWNNKLIECVKCHVPLQDFDVIYISLCDQNGEMTHAQI